MGSVENAGIAKNAGSGKDEWWLTLGLGRAEARTLPIVEPARALVGSRFIVTFQDFPDLKPINGQPALSSVPGDRGVPGVLGVSITQFGFRPNLQ